MKFIYTLLAIVAMAAFASCTDDAPQPITAINCESSVVEVTSGWVTFALKVNPENESLIERYYVTAFDANDKEVAETYFSFEDGQNVGYADISAGNSPHYNSLISGNTYSYQIEALVRTNSVWDARRVVVDEGTFAIPTVEEYLANLSVEATMETTLITNNSAQLTFKYPENIKDNNSRNMPIAIVSKSPEFANPLEMKLSPYYDAEIGGYRYSYHLTDLEENTQYFVKLHGNFILETALGGKISINDYDLKVNPDSFKTLSGGEVVSSARCKLTEKFILDDSASLSIALPSGWDYYKEYANDPAKCTVIYSTDPSFKEYIDLKIGASYDYSIYLTDLAPETTYYIGLKGDFKCTQVNQVLKDYIMPADKSIMTRHLNQIESIDGHGAVDLGLSVKWAYSNVFDGTNQYFAWPEVSGIKDIAGTEYDIAQKYWGDSWQMPSPEQMAELINNCEEYRIEGKRIYSAKNGNYIILQGDGCNYGYLRDIGELFYWTSSASPTLRDYAVCYVSYIASFVQEARGINYCSSAPISARMPVRAVTKK